MNKIMIFRIVYGTQQFRKSRIQKMAFYYIIRGSHWTLLSTMVVNFKSKTV